MRYRAPIACFLLLTVFNAARAQEQVDKIAPADQRAGVSLADLMIRARVTAAAPEQAQYTISWRRGGEGLGGEVTRGAFAGADGRATVGPGEWSAALPLAELAGKGAKGWVFPTVVVLAPSLKGREAESLRDVAVEFEVAERGKTLKTFSETAVTGPTVGLAIPAGEADRAAFVKSFQGLSGHARARREHVEAFVATLPGGTEAAEAPKKFGVIGHLAGYGEKVGYGIRHNNPAIVADECRTLRLLGMNGFVGEDSVRLADAAGEGAHFRKAFWGGPGAGSPMGHIIRRGEPEDVACPFDPALPPKMAESVASAIAEHGRVKAERSWGLWWDEIGVAQKHHLAQCARCAAEFRTYCKSQKLEPGAFGKQSWDEVSPYMIWPKLGDPEAPPVPVPTDAGDALRFYYTHRFMTYATAQLFPATAKALADAGIPLYAMQGPTPSWSGHSLDWHEFYDLGANRAFVWETSNRDPRTWPFESYLADIGAGIARRHDMPMGVLIKPHRGAPLQRMLSAVARGVETFEWYTYGPDYAKGDSFSQSTELLDDVARAGRFLARNEDLLYGAKPAFPAEVAFCSPRSSEVWGKATDLGVTAFEDAKWVYLALRHANVPVDVLSEQQLAEPGALKNYKALYVCGPNLRNDATAGVLKWVEAGGALWTDAMGMSRDEANQPNGAMDKALGGAKRELETWGTVPAYRATTLEPLVERAAPKGAASFVLLETSAGMPKRVSVGRERSDVVADDASGRHVEGEFADGRPAFWTRRVGKGGITVAAFWAGLSYSAGVRRADFDMAADLDRALSPVIVRPAIRAGVVQRVACRHAEAHLLENGGRRFVALMNWDYAHAEGGGRPALRSHGNVTLLVRDGRTLNGARSALHGRLEVGPAAGGAGWRIVVPRLDEIDLIVLD